MKKRFSNVVLPFAVLCIAIGLANMNTAQAGGGGSSKKYSMEISNNSNTIIRMNSGYFQQNCQKSSGNYEIEARGTINPGATRSFSYKIKSACSAKIVELRAYPDLGGRNYGLYFMRYSKGDGKYTVHNSDIQQWKNGKNVVMERN